MKKGPEIVFSVLAICVAIMVTAAVCFGTDESTEVEEEDTQEVFATAVSACLDNYLYRYFYQGTTLVSVVQVFKENSNHTGTVPVHCRE